MLSFASCWHASVVLTSGTIVGSPTIKWGAQLGMSFLGLWRTLGRAWKPLRRATWSSRHSSIATAPAHTVGQGSRRPLLQGVSGERTAEMEDRAKRYACHWQTA